MDQNANRTAEEFLSGVITDPYRESEAVVPAAEPTEKPREHLDLWECNGCLQRFSLCGESV